MGGPQFDRNFGGYRVFCGDLGSRTNKFELEREFDTFGPLVDCWVARNPPGFAFIVYKHADDAERAVEELDGRTICGRRVRVEHARPTGGKKGGSFGRGYLRQRSPGYRSPLRTLLCKQSPDTKRDDDDRRPSRRDRKRSPSRSRSRSSSHEERRSSRRHRRSRSHSRSKKESKRKRRSSSSRSPVEKKTRQRSSSRERSSTPVDKNRDHGSRSPSKDDNKKETKKNDTDKSNNEKIDNDDNDESRSSPTPGESETKNNDDD
ncbi:unnamed protein product [Rotaria magnacalcarata]